MANELVTDDVVDDEAVADDTIGDAQLRESAALSVIGRSANSAGNPADIAVAAGSGLALREASNVLGFGTLTPAAIAAIVTAATKGGSGKLLKTIQYNAQGMIEAAVVEGVANTDYLAPGWDLLEVQSQGGDVQTISIPTAGDTDEQYLIIGSGKMKAGTLTLGFNNDATAPTYTTTIVSNGSNSGSGTVVAGTYLGPAHFRIDIDARTHDSGNRVGFHQGIFNDNGTNRDAVSGGFKWSDTTNNITTIILKSSVAGGFLAGFKTKVFKRKVTS